LKQSIYLNSSSENETICIPADGQKSTGENETFAWDTLNTIVHEAAIFVYPGHKFRKRISKDFNEKIMAL
jgi:hypothetical protein